MEDNSDSDKEFDRHELEIALYSQIHFDSNTNQETTHEAQDCGTLKSFPYHIGVQEFTKTIKPSSEPAGPCGDFIAFFNDSNKNTVNDLIHLLPCNAISQPQKHLSLTNKGESSSDTVYYPKMSKHKKLKSAGTKGDEASDTALLSKKNKTKKLKVDKTNVKLDKKEDDKLSTVLDKTSSQIEPGSCKDKRNTALDINKNTACPKLKQSYKESKEKETLLTFSVSKPSERVNLPESTENKKPIRIKSSNHSENMLKSPQSPISKLADFDTSKVDSLVSRNQLSKTVGFPKQAKLELHSPAPNKRKSSLCKMSSAVKPRKPVVSLRRRAPPVVLQPESDTNTDYSESESSSVNSTPVKGQRTALGGTPGLAGQQIHPQKVPALALVTPKSAGLANKDEGISVISDEHESDCQEPPKSGLVISSSDTDTSEAEDQQTVDKIEISSEVSVTSSDERLVQSVSDSSSSDERLVQSVSDNSSSDERLVQSVSDSSSSEDSEDDFLVKHNFEFNLAAGVDNLMASPNTDKWRIGEKDRLNVVGVHKRYFAPLSVNCRNCRMDGHLSRDCPKPAKRTCLFCGGQGHLFQACPEAVCFKCNTPGHRFNQCKEQALNKNSMCDRCWMSGHRSEQCPDRWRQFHITVIEKSSQLATTEKTKKNPRVYCYNCGKKGHLGYECRMPRLNRFTQPNYPYVAQYDTKAMCTDSKSGSKKNREHSREDKSRPNLTPLVSRSEMKRDRTKRSKQQITETDSPRTQVGNLKQNSGGDQQMVGSAKKKRNRTRKKYELGQDFVINLDKEHSKIPQGTSYVQISDGSDQDIVEDFQGHQVKDNEWWNKTGRPPRKKRRLNEDMLVGRLTQGQDKPKGNDWNRPRGNQAQWGGSKFDRPIQVSPGDAWARGTSSGTRDRSRDVDTQTRDQSREATTRKPDWSREASERTNVLNEPKTHGRHKNQIVGRNFQPAHQPSSFANKQAQNASLMPHSASWPTFETHSSGYQRNKNGFRAQNDLFIAVRSNRGPRFSRNRR